MSGKYKIKTNLLMANLYARNQEMLDTRIKERKQSRKDEKTYVELVQKPVRGGVKEEFIRVPYPITPDYVKSFVGNCDYRANIDEAVNAPARGKNLGDMSALQDLLSKDTDAARALFKHLTELGKQVESAKKKQSKTEVASNG